MPPIGIGSLARDLFASRESTWLVEERLIALLEERFPGWSPKFPKERSWVARPPDQLEVYEVPEDAPARAALARAGFREVTLHSHAAEQFLTCICQPRRTQPT